MGEFAQYNGVVYNDRPTNLGDHRRHQQYFMFGERAAGGLRQERPELSKLRRIMELSPLVRHDGDDLLSSECFHGRSRHLDDRRDRRFGFRRLPSRRCQLVHVRRLGPVHQEFGQLLGLLATTVNFSSSLNSAPAGVAYTNFIFSVTPGVTQFGIYQALSTRNNGEVISADQY